MMTGQLIAIDQIAIGDRLRTVHPDRLAELSQSISVAGLIQPISVVAADGGYRLVAGRHRVEACRQLGWETIPAIILDADELARQLVEIDENLFRVELSILERGEHLVRRSEVLEALGQRARSGRPKKGVTVTPFLATTAGLAEAAGVSERTAQRYMQIARALPLAIRDVVRGTPLADKPGELEELAQIEDLDEQLTVAQAIASGDLYEYYGIEDARRRLDETSRMCGTCYRIVEREHLIDGKVVHGIGCKRDDEDDEDDDLYEDAAEVAREPAPPTFGEPTYGQVQREVMPEVQPDAGAGFRALMLLISKMEVTSRRGMDDLLADVPLFERETLLVKIPRQITWLRSVKKALRDLKARDIAAIGATADAGTTR